MRLTASPMLRPFVPPRNRQTLGLIALFLVAAGCAAANQQLSSNGGTAPFDARSVVVPYVSKTPTLADFEGMQPRGDIARQMARVSDFIQSDPSDGQKATQKTEVYLGYDDKALYVVWLCFDSEPRKVRANLVRRENIVEPGRLSAHAK